MHDIEDYIGKTINSWTVLSRGPNDDKAQQYWNVQCSCGEVARVRASHIVRGLSKNCYKCRPQSQKKSGITASFLSSYKNRALKKGLDFEITVSYVQDLYEKQGGLCALTGEVLTLPSRACRDFDFNTSIDRIDSSKGYTRRNIQLVTKMVNACKLATDEEAFVDMCVKVAKTKGGSCGS